MRILNSSEKNELAVRDAMSDSELLLYYRTPTYAERVRYQNDLWKRSGGKMKMYPEARVRHGLEIMTGFRTGDFGDEKGKPISSDPKEKNYRKDWKKLIENSAPEIPALLAYEVFENVVLKEFAAELDTEIDVEFDVEIDGDKENDFLSSSNGSSTRARRKRKSSASRTREESQTSAAAKGAN